MAGFALCAKEIESPPAIRKLQRTAVAPRAHMRSARQKDILGFISLGLSPFPHRKLAEILLRHYDSLPVEKGQILLHKEASFRALRDFLVPVERLRICGRRACSGCNADACGHFFGTRCGSCQYSACWQP